MDIWHCYLFGYLSPAVICSLRNSNYSKILTFTVTLFSLYFRKDTHNYRWVSLWSVVLGVDISLHVFVNNADIRTASTACCRIVVNLENILFFMDVREMVLKLITENLQYCLNLLGFVTRHWLSACQKNNIVRSTLERKLSIKCAHIYPVQRYKLGHWVISENLYSM